MVRILLAVQIPEHVGAGVAVTPVPRSAGPPKTVTIMLLPSWRQVEYQHFCSLMRYVVVQVIEGQKNA
jgi:hypothetical protein